MVAGDGKEHHRLYPREPAPALRWHFCFECGQSFLRLAHDRHHRWFLETVEPSCPWIRLLVNLRDFQSITQVSLSHGCRPVIPVAELEP